MQTADPKKPVEIKIKKFMITERLLHILMLWPSEEEKALLAFQMRIAKELPQARTMDRFAFPLVTVFLPTGHRFNIYRNLRPVGPHFIAIRATDWV